MKTHKNLDVCKEAVGFVKRIYVVTSKFLEEIYSLIAQIRRCAIPIPSNIVGGAARNGKKEFMQFLYIAPGTCTELDTQLIISKELGYIDSEFSELSEDIEKIKSKLLSLIRYLRNKNE